MELKGNNEKSTLTLTPADVCEAIFKHLNTQYRIPEKIDGLIFAVKEKGYNMPSVVITFDTDVDNITPQEQDTSTCPICGNNVPQTCPCV